MSVRGGELLYSGSGRFWAEGRNPAKKADVDGLYLAKAATASKSMESCRKVLLSRLREGPQM